MPNEDLEEYNDAHADDTCPECGRKWCNGICEEPTLKPGWIRVQLKSAKKEFDSWPKQKQERMLRKKHENKRTSSGLC